MYTCSYACTRYWKVNIFDDLCKKRSCLVTLVCDMYSKYCITIYVYTLYSLHIEIYQILVNFQVKTQTGEKTV